MASIVSESELFWSSWEPKLKQRAMVLMDGVPSYMIRKFERPKLEQPQKELPHINLVRYVKGKSKWTPITMQLYDPIVPSGAQATMEWIRLHHESVTGRDGYMDFYKKDITLNVLGPVGDIVESWVLKGSFVTEANFGDMDWAVDDPAEINLTISYDFAILSY